MYDVVIAGGGPAGSVLAYDLGRERKVLVVEKRVMHGPSYAPKTEKCCGGLLDHSAQDALAERGIGLPETVLESPQVFYGHCLDFDNHMERDYPRRYLNINRTAFDRYLLKQAAKQPDVTLWENACVQQYEEQTDGLSVQVMDLESGEKKTVRTKLLVGADGASSTIRRLLSERYLIPVSGGPVFGAPRRYVCLEEHYAVSGAFDLSCYTILFDRYVTDFYGWVIPKKDRMLVGAAIPEGKDVRLRYARLKADLISAGYKPGEPIYRSGALLFRPRPLDSVLPGHGRVLLAGEAAGLISPSSAEGISYALRSGGLLAQTILKEDIRNLEYAYYDALKGLRREILFKSLKSPVMYEPGLRRMVFRSGLYSIKRTT